MVFAKTANIINISMSSCTANNYVLSLKEHQDKFVSHSIQCWSPCLGGIGGGAVALGATLPTVPFSTECLSAAGYWLAGLCAGSTAVEPWLKAVSTVFLASRRGVGTGAGITPTGLAVGIGGGPPRPGTGGPRLGMDGAAPGGAHLVGGTFFGDVDTVLSVLPSRVSSGAACVRGRGFGNVSASEELKLSTLLFLGNADDGGNVKSARLRSITLRARGTGCCAPWLPESTLRVMATGASADLCLRCCAPDIQRKRATVTWMRQPWPDTIASLSLYKRASRKRNHFL